MIFLKNIRETVKLIPVLLTIPVLFTACLKDDDDMPVQDVAGLMAFNLSPDQSAVGYRIDNNSLTSNALGFGNYTGSYLPVYDGQRRVEAFSFSSGMTLDTLSRSFTTDKFYSAFLFGKSGNHRLTVMQDEIDDLSYVNNKAYVRVVNGFTDTTLVPTFTYEIADSVLYSENLVYRGVGSFVPVNAEEVDVMVRNGTDSMTSRTISFTSGNIYTLLLLNKADSTQMDPEIKFIVNGTITP